jgi:hypothetical protein
MCYIWNDDLELFIWIANKSEIDTEARTGIVLKTRGI